ncbi:MAG: DUF3488 and transglutaminase-like domain-containing protein [Calditerrivibrio sp.]|nr:DUF3488 and transglutaminase-like domain-containing protein [Calditerrivibrio sp.]
MVNLKRYIDVLISILVIISIVSVSKHLNPIFLIITLAVIVFNFFNEKRYFIYINRNFLTIIGLFLTIYIFYNTSLNNLVNSLIHIMTIFISIKFLENKKYRDYMQIVVLSIFLITASGLLDVGAVFILYIISAIFLLNILIIMLTIYDNTGDKFIKNTELKALTIKSSIIPLVSIPLAIFLFFVIPRTPTPLFEFLNVGESSKTGFTSNINLGQVSNIQDDNRVAFRAKMQEIDERDLYWRGIVFDEYRDGKWSSTTQKNIKRPKIENAKIIDYEIYLEPTGESYLISPDRPYSVTIDKEKVYFTEKLELKIKNEVNQKIYYKGKFFISEYLYDDYSDIEPSSDSSNTSGRIKEFSKQFYDKNPLIMVSSIKNYFRSNFTYSTTGLPTSSNPIEEFLFDNKKGNCEYFASAAALILRSNGFPARLVGGYLGGFYNREGGYYIITNKNAHVWVEALFDNKWYRIDPTPASVENFTNRNKLPLSFRVKLYADYVSYYWTKLVINYNLQTQLQIAMKAGKSLKQFNFKVEKRYILYFIIFLSSLLVLFSPFLLRKKGDYNRYIEKFYKLLIKKGVNIDRQLTLEQNVKGISNEELRKNAEIFVAEVNNMLFKNGKIEKNTLQKQLNNIKKL